MRLVLHVAVVKLKGLVSIIQHGDCRKDALLARQRYARQAAIEGRCIDEGLEHRTRWAFCQRVVQLAHSIVATADQRQNLPRVRVQCNQRHLRIDDVLLRQHKAVLRSHGVATTHHRINFFHSLLYGDGSSILQVRVERGVDVQAFCVNITVAVALV